MPITVNTGGASTLAGIEWTLNYNATDVVSVSVTAGTAATTAAKSLFCSGGSGTYTCVASGINSTPLASGVIANAALQISSKTTALTSAIQIGNTSAVDLSGASVASSGGSSAISISGSAPAVPVPSKLTCSPSSLAPSASSTCTVTLSAAAPTSGAAVALASNNTNVAVPASVTVAAGATSAAFTAKAGAFSSAASVAVTATLNGASASTTLSLTTSSTTLTVSGLACSPTALSTQQASTCTVKLSANAPSGGTVVALTDNSSVLTVPTSVTVPAAASSATFSITAGSITSSATATVTATLGSSSATASISLTPVLVISGISCSPSSLSSQQSGTCTVTLTAAAPSGGSTVTLTDNSSLLTEPASVTVPAAATSAPVTITAGTISADGSATITAALNSKSSSASINLLATRLVKSLTCSPASISSQQTSTCTVALNMAAPSGGVSVALTNNSANLTVPASVMVPAAATSAGFAAKAGTLSSSSSATVTASLNGSSLSASLSLVPSIVPSTLTCSPLSLSSNESATCTVTLSKVAPTGGLIVALSSNNTSLKVPASVTVAAGVQSATFSAAAGILSVNATVTLTATLNGVSVTATEMLAPPAVPTSVTCTPTVLSGSQQSSCNVTLLKAAPSGGTSVSLVSSSASLTAPKAITVAAGSSSGSFAIKSAVVGASTAVSVKATAYSVSQLAWLTLSPLTGAAAASVTAPQLTPYSGSGTDQVFTVSATDSSADPVATIDVLFNSSLVPGNACYVRLNFSTSIVRLMDDAGVTWSSPLAMGSAASLNNTRCVISAQSVSATRNAGTASAQFALHFNSAFSGQQNIYTKAMSSKDVSSGWQTMGTWWPDAVSGAAVGVHAMRDHLSEAQMYTADSGEYEMLAARGLDVQGTPFQVYDAPANVQGVEAVPLLRLYNTAQQTHFWTTDYGRYVALLQGSGYVGEGVTGFVLPQAAGNLVPLYQLQSCCKSDVYRWTVDDAERGTLLKDGAWTDAGVVGWVLPPSGIKAQAPDTNSGEPALTTSSDAAAGQKPPFAAGQVIRLYGHNLAGATGMLRVNDSPADVLSATDDSVTVRLPLSLPGAGHAEIALQSGGAGSATLPVSLVQARPSLFVHSIFGGGQAVASNADGTANSPDAPASSGSDVKLYVTGLPDSLQNLPLSAFVAGSPAQVKSVTATEKAGIWAVTVTIPSDAASNPAATVEVECGFTPIQSGVTIAIR